MVCQIATKQTHARQQAMRQLGRGRPTVGLIGLSVEAWHQHAQLCLAIMGASGQHIFCHRGEGERRRGGEGERRGRHTYSKLTYAIMLKRSESDAESGNSADLRHRHERPGKAGGGLPRRGLRSKRGLSSLVRCLTIIEVHISFYVSHVFSMTFYTLIIL